ncbi:MAG: UDP-N-acetylglucosamine 1-carboxyvinyltransferase [Firmicutes bacterium]|nr:UDP-N-acetylglucosamine 1-carboxyvinyltransferase [Bacillota bacterium]
MGQFVIEGKRRLTGKIRINGAKNSALKLMVAALLGQGDFQIEDVPHITDVLTMCGVLEALGVRTHLEKNRLQLKVSSLQGRAPQELAKSMRASVQVMGPLLARLGWVEVAQPGGCAIGTRSLDLHLSGLAKLGAEIEVRDELLVARAKKLKGADISLRYPSVGATENILMAAVLAEGESVIRNAAQEPEILDIQSFLNKMGAKISGAGTSEIRITGVGELGSTNFQVIPDRIEAGTYLIAFLITGGHGTLENVAPEHLASLLKVLRTMGAYIDSQEDSLTIYSPQQLQPFHIATNPYPEFPTDLQPQMVALATQAGGVSTLTEGVFDQRFGYTPELIKLGAKIEVVSGNGVVIHGPTKLTGAQLISGDLRAGAALVLAALAAEGQTVLTGIEHIDRGYEELAARLSQLGAKILRIP